MSTLSGMNITVSGAVLNVQSNKVVVGYSNYIPSTPSGLYNWLERAVDFEKLEAQKKKFMKVNEWLEFKKLNNKITATQEKLVLVSQYVSQGVSIKWVVENIIGEKYEGGDKSSKD